VSGRSRRGDPYAGQPGRRLFVALPLPREAVDAITELVATVRADELPPGMHDVRWVRLDGLHLTLRFLGPTLDDRIAPTVQAVRDVARAAAPIDAVLAGTGTFPAHGRPRTLWIGVPSGDDEIAQLARKTNDALLEAGWPLDDRPVRAHLTLARSDGLVAGSLVAGRLRAALEDRSIPCRLERLVLYESITGGGPARYEPVEVADLGH
jgi:2'-5' RNA ligase